MTAGAGRGRVGGGADRRHPGGSRRRYRRRARQDRLADGRPRFRTAPVDYKREGRRRGAGSSLPRRYRFRRLRTSVGRSWTRSMSAMNIGGRVAVCGLISNYNDEGPIPGPKDFGRMLMKRADRQRFHRHRSFPSRARRLGPISDAGSPRGVCSGRITSSTGWRTLPTLWACCSPAPMTASW